MKSTVNKLFDPKNPTGKILKYSISIIATALAIHFLINISVNPDDFKRRNPLVDLLITPTLLDSAKTHNRAIGRKSILLHLYETNQIDTIFVDFNRLVAIEDSISLLPTDSIKI